MKRIFKYFLIITILLSLFVGSNNIKETKKVHNNDNYAIKYVEEEKEKKISIETEVVIVVGAIVISGGLGFTLYWFIYKKKSKKNKE